MFHVHAARVYGVEDRITFIHADMRKWMEEYGASISAPSNDAGGSEGQAESDTGNQVDA
jgi:hypothetical protein